MNIEDVNLLSPFKKGKLEQLVSFIFVKEMLAMILLTATLIAIAITWSYIVLQENFNNLAESAALVNKEFSQYNLETRRLNALAKNLNQAATGYTRLVPPILNLAACLPPDIKINGLQMNRDSDKIFISGTAQTREALLRYQGTLKSIEWLTEVDTPISQLFQKTDINFTIQANFKDLAPVKKTVQPKKTGDIL